MGLNVAWIGLGQMGLPTSKKVAAAGHTVRAFDVNPPADAAGLIMVDSPKAAAVNCDMLCIAVFSDAQVEEVLTGPDGVLAGLKPGAIVAIFTTGSIESAQALAAKAPSGIAILDTCFSRKFSEFASGMLTLLVGGDADAIERGRPVFDTFARDIFHVGPSGSGRAIKLVNNILFASHLQLAKDAMKLAEGLGLDRKATATALVDCSGGSEALNQFRSDDIEAILETTARYMVKDVGAAMDAGHGAGVDMGTLETATISYRKS